MMRFDLITIFPEFFVGPLDHGIVRRAKEAGLAQIYVQDLREFTKDRHRTVDDRPFGGGEGMVLKPEPLFEAVEKLLGRGVGAEAKVAREPGTAILLMSAAGRLFTQETARRYAKLERLLLICGRYEGVDERVAEHLATEEICIGDYVLSGGELPAAIVIDAVTRLLPGVLGDERSSEEDSFAQGLLDWPHYTRPEVFEGLSVPPVLLSGDHAGIRRWRLRCAVERTQRRRPELIAAGKLAPEAQRILDQLPAARAAAEEDRGK
jgi:tRNA (guanine37-N1)-methyltransferase